MPRKKEAEKDPLSDLSGHESQRSLFSKEPAKSALSEQSELEPQAALLSSDSDDFPKALPRFLKKMGWTIDEWKEIRKHWLEKPNDLTKRDWLMWTTAKKERYREAPELAIERQKRLRSDEWITAFFLAQDWGHKRIAKELKVEVDYVDKLVGQIKTKADCDTQPGVVRWFLGL